MFVFRKPAETNIFCKKLVSTGQKIYFHLPQLRFVIQKWFSLEGKLVSISGDGDFLQKYMFHYTEKLLALGNDHFLRKINFNLGEMYVK